MTLVEYTYGLDQEKTEIGEIIDIGEYKVLVLFDDGDEVWIDPKYLTIVGD